MSEIMTATMDSQNICAECCAGISNSELETESHIEALASSPVHSSLASNLPPSTHEQMNAAREALRDIEQEIGRAHV